MVQNTKARIFTYSLQTVTDFKCKVIENLFDGLHVVIDNQEVWLRLTGLFNAYNILSVYATAVILGENKDEILSIISNLKPVEGRFDFVQNPKNIKVIVDYAHSPDALYNVLKSIESLRTRNEKLITVMGAGGDRDRTKRPEMGRIVSESSDMVILTSDNPRSEDPEIIIEELKKGIELSKLKSVLSIVNRKEAIKTACVMAIPGDIILVAGKGHEKYQEIKGVKYPFDDKKIIEEMLLLSTANNN